MAEGQEQMKWQDALLKYGKLAIETGQRLEFVSIKRPDKTSWRIYLRDLVEHGEETEFDDDD